MMIVLSNVHWVQMNIFSKIVLYLYLEVHPDVPLVLFYYWDKSVPGVPLMMVVDVLGSTGGII